MTAGSTAGGPLFSAAEFDGAGLAEERRRRGRSVSVCIPARDEAATIAAIVKTVRTSFVGAAGGVDLVDEVIVADDGSTDETAEEATAAGASVVTVDGPGDGQGAGKGAAMRAALGASSGDLVVFLDGDVEGFSPLFVTGLLGPLIEVSGVQLVKGFYERPLGGATGEGGRVTELLAKPAIELLFPHLAGVRQPLAGETAAPRVVLEAVGLDPGWGVELALLVDVASRYGAEAVGQVDLGVRVHRNRPLSELRVQATDILATALERAGLRPPGEGSHDEPGGADEES